jgi:cytochrome P450
LVSRPIVPSLLLFLTVLAGLLLLLSRISGIRAARNFRKQHGCEPVRARVPLKDPIWGLDFIYEHLTAFREKRSLEAGANRFRTLGHTFAVDGLVRSISTTDPENIKSILSVNFKDYSHKGRQTLMKPLLGGGIFASDGAEWAHSRAMLRPNFTKDQVADLDVVGRHISHLIDAIPQNTTIDLQPLLLQFTLDSATEFLLGHSTNGLVHGDGEGEMFGAAFEASLKDIAYQFRLGPFRHLQWSRRKARDNYATCQRYVDRFVRRAMDLRKAESADDERNCFLKELAKSNEPEERIRDELLNILLAGRDTTASLLASFFFLVARRPDVWKKLRNEVNKLEGCSPTYEQLREMKFVRYCLNESE